MKEFVVYTALRLVLLVGAFAIIAGVWALAADEVNVFWSLVLAFVVSGVGSYLLLNAQREAFARRVEARATRATQRFEERRAREDVD